MKIHVFWFLQILRCVLARSWNTFVSFPAEHSTSHVVSTRTRTETGSRNHKSFFESFDTKLDSTRHAGLKSLAFHEKDLAAYVKHPATVPFHDVFGLSSPLQGSPIFAEIYEPFTQSISINSYLCYHIDTILFTRCCP